ncbi:MAG: hypothetical protein VKM92_05680 [Cyanobacteriota bacterium]|nr:hypothetical protein [Cyanobacteriota bacterium]
MDFKVSPMAKVSVPLGNTPPAKSLGSAGLEPIPCTAQLIVATSERGSLKEMMNSNSETVWFELPSLAATVLALMLKLGPVTKSSFQSDRLTRSPSLFAVALKYKLVSITVN